MLQQINILEKYACFYTRLSRLILSFLLIPCSDLVVEREQHSSSIRQAHKLHSQVGQLGEELSQAKQEKEQVII